MREHHALNVVDRRERTDCTVPAALAATTIFRWCPAQPPTRIGQATGQPPVTGW